MVNPDRNLYDPPYDDALLYDNEMEPERPRSRSLIAILAFVVLAAFAGVVWVAYNQGVQQGSRGVNPPVLTADPGPTRIEPNQLADASVSNPAPEKSYERLWAGESTGTDKSVTPLGEGRDVPTTQELVQPAIEPPARGGPFKEGPPVDPRMDSTLNLSGEMGESNGDVGEPRMTAPSLSRPTSPRGRQDITAMLPSSSGEGPVVEAVPEPAPPAVSRPSVKQTAPSGSRTAAPTTIIPPVESVPAPEILSAPESSVPPTEAAPVSGGKVAIQLGSFPTSELAASQWSKVKGANQALLGEYSPKIVEATIPGKGLWHRLRVVGFADKSAAKAVCDQLQANGQACIVAGK